MSDESPEPPSPSLAHCFHPWGPPGAPVWAILVDCSLTRRKRTNAVQRPDGSIAFQSRHLWDCFEFIDAEGIEVYVLLNGALTGREDVSALIVKKGL